MGLPSLKSGWVFFGGQTCGLFFLVVGGRFWPGFCLHILRAAASAKLGARNRSVLCFGIVLGMDFMLFFFGGGV